MKMRGNNEEVRERKRKRKKEGGGAVSGELEIEIAVIRALSAERSKRSRAYYCSTVHLSCYLCR